MSNDSSNAVFNVREATGSCLCSAVQFTAKKMDHDVGACHCEMCRKWGGGPLLAVDCGDEVEFKGEQAISVFDSSEWADRGFCKECGTHLFWRLKQTQQHIMPVGLFEKTQGLVLDHEVFIDEKPSFYSFAEQTKSMTGDEVFAMFSGE